MLHSSRLQLPCHVLLPCHCPVSGTLVSKLGTPCQAVLKCPAALALSCFNRKRAPCCTGESQHESRVASFRKLSRHVPTGEAPPRLPFTETNLREHSETNMSSQEALSMNFQSRGLKHLHPCFNCLSTASLQHMWGAAKAGVSVGLETGGAGRSAT
jgi:hypothetical protein